MDKKIETNLSAEEMAALEAERKKPYAIESVVLSSGSSDFQMSRDIESLYERVNERALKAGMVIMQPALQIVVLKHPGSAADGEGDAVVQYIVVAQWVEREAMAKYQREQALLAGGGPGRGRA